MTYIGGKPHKLRVLNASRGAGLFRRRIAPVECAAFGDSYVAGAGGAIQNNDYRGPHHWANIRLGSPLRIRTSHQIGFTGETIQQVADDVGLITALNPRPAFCFLLSLGHNDAHGVFSAATSETHARAIVDALRAADIVPIFGPVLPKDTATAQQIANCATLTAMWRQIAAEAKGIFCDWTQATINSGTGLPLSGILFDETHPAARGAKIMGDVIADTIGGLVSGEAERITAANPGILPNALNPGSVSISSNGFTGTAATGLVGYVSSADTGGTKVCSKVPRAAGGDWQQMVLTNVTAAVGNYRTALFHTHSYAALGLVEGGIYEAIVEYEIDPGHTNLAGPFVRVVENNGSGGAVFQWHGNASASVAKDLPDLSNMLRGIIRSPTFPIRADVGADSLQVHFGLQGIGNAAGGVTATGRFIATLMRVG